MAVVDVCEDEPEDYNPVPFNLLQEPLEALPGYHPNWNEFCQPQASLLLKPS